MKLNPNDRAALELAIERCPEPFGSLAHELAKESWIKAATYAAFHCQMRALYLKPWQDPPCEIADVDDPINPQHVSGHQQAAELLRQMLALGISRYHPDPLRAIAKAKRAKAK